MALGDEGSAFTVELDRPDGRYRAGDPLRGVVLLTGVDDAVRGVDVKLRWRTVGAGNTDQADVATLRLPVSAMGGRARCPFELALPAGPVSYRGPIVGVEWRLIVSVDVAWARDPERLIPLELLSADPQRTVDAGAYRSVAAPIRHELGPNADTAGGRRPTHTGGGFLLALGMGAIGSTFHGVAFLMAPLGFVAAGAIAIAAARRWYARDTLGQPIAELRPATTRRGQDVEARLTLAPRRNVEIVIAMAELRGEETAVKGSGSSSTTHNHVLHAHAVDLSGLQRINAGQTVTLAVALPIPQGAAPTFGATSNNVTWTVKLTLDVIAPATGARYDFEETLVLHVQPG